jgi:chloride channel protein, CIC family
MSHAPVAPPETATTPARSRGAEALAQRLARLTFDTNFAEDRFFLILSVFIGIFSGLAVVCFRVAIDWSRIALMGPLPHPSAWRIIGAPAAVGLLVAVLVIHFFPQVRGSGVNQTKAALYIFNGYIPFRNAIGKFLCSALAIGSGQSLGPEDPSLQIGASLASALGRRLELSREKLRLLAPVGAAAGLAAAFNAPISVFRNSMTGKEIK